MSFTFLRPLALPRSSTISQFLGIARASTTALPSPTTPASNPAKPYRITRTTTNNPPVYLLRKRGGNLKQTLIRRIEGDINVLKSDLQQALGVDEKEVMINQLTKHIKIKGHKKPEVLKFLADHKF